MIIRQVKNCDSAKNVALGKSLQTGDISEVNGYSIFGGQTVGTEKLFKISLVKDLEFVKEIWVTTINYREY